MSSYIIRRLSLIIPTMFLVTVIAFASVRFIPGSVIDLMSSQMIAQSAAAGWEDTHEYIRHALGMDVPIQVQYVRWVGDVLHGDLGRSLWSSSPVVQEIAVKLPISIEIGLIGLVTALLIALPIGVYSAVRQDTLGDYVSRTIAILCISIPSLWIGTMVIVYPAIWFDWSPPIGYIPFFEDPVGNLKQFMLPGFIMGLSLMGTTLRMTRTMMLEVLRQDYIRTAWAKGLQERVVIFRHALKNALIPIVTIVGVNLPVLIAGSIVIESIFSLPGMGFLMLKAIETRDYPVISAINLIMAGFVLIINLVVDLTYSYLDPRIRYKHT